MTVEQPRRSAAVEDYTKAIYLLAGSENGTVTTTTLARRLGVSPGSVSAMLRKLAARGLAVHEPYHGVRLTAQGQRIALKMIRHHRLLKLYLAQELGVPWDRVSEEAEALEHVLSEDLIDRIAAKLGNPTHDPYGAPIPDAHLVLDQPVTQRLTDLQVGQRGCFVSVADTDPEMLRYLHAKQITIGQHIEVIARDPFEGPLAVRFESEKHLLGLELAAAMRIAVTV